MQVVGLDVDERPRVEVLRVDHGVVDVGEDLELVGDADVVAVRRQPVRHDALADLTVLERLDHAVLERHLPDPAVGFDGHMSVVESASWTAVRRHAVRAASITGGKATAGASARRLSTIDVTSGK